MLSNTAALLDVLGWGLGLLMLSPGLVGLVADIYLFFGVLRMEMGASIVDLVCFVSWHLAYGGRTQYTLKWSQEALGLSSFVCSGWVPLFAYIAEKLLDLAAVLAMLPTESHLLGCLGF